MPIRITKETDSIRINTLTVGIYALPGIGKTSVAFTANKPLLLDFDKGAYRTRNRKDSVAIDSWDDVAGMTKEDLDAYDTIIVDTAGRALDFLSADIILKNPKHGNGGSLSLQGFGALKSRFGSWLKLMKTFGKDVVLLAHMDEKQEGDVMKERLDIQGGSKAEIYKSVDAMAKIYVEGKNRRMDFSPREGSLGKNPGQMDVLTIPDFTSNPEFLATVIGQIKDSINSLSDAQMERAKTIEVWRTAIAALDSTEEFNKLLTPAKSETPEIRKMLNDAATTYGLKFDTKAGAFVEAA